MTVRLNVRVGPSIRCKLLSSLLPGTSVVVSHQTKNKRWSRVVVKDIAGQKLVGQIEGWVSTQLLQKKVSSYPEIDKSFTDQDLLIGDSEPDVVIVPIQNLEPLIGSTFDTEILNAIEKLKLNYELGDGQATADLYISSGRENNIRGADNIRKYYKKAFSKTLNREFGFSILKYEKSGQSTAVVEGRMDLTMITKRSSKKTVINANFTILLVKISNQYKIASFDWDEV